MPARGAILRTWPSLPGGECGGAGQFHWHMRTMAPRVMAKEYGGAFAPSHFVDLEHHRTVSHGTNMTAGETLKTVPELLAKLKQSEEDVATLLDRTPAFLARNPPHARTHSVHTLPVP